MKIEIINTFYKRQKMKNSPQSKEASSFVTWHPDKSTMMEAGFESLAFK